MVISPQCRLKVRENEPESPFDEPNEATKGPSETPIVDRVAPYRAEMALSPGPRAWSARDLPRAQWICRTHATFRGSLEGTMRQRTLDARCRSWRSLEDSI